MEDITLAKLREAVKAINLLADLVDEAQKHPHTRSDLYPDLVQEAEEIRERFKDWWDDKPMKPREFCDCLDVYGQKVCTCGVNAKKLLRL